MQLYTESHLLLVPSDRCTVHLGSMGFFLFFCLMSISHFYVVCGGIRNRCTYRPYIFIVMHRKISRYRPTIDLIGDFRPRHTTPYSLVGNKYKQQKNRGEKTGSTMHHRPFRNQEISSPNNNKK